MIKRFALYFFLLYNSISFSQTDTIKSSLGNKTDTVVATQENKTISEYKAPKPKITLIYSFDYNYNNGRPTKTKRITHYYLNDNSKVKLEVGYAKKEVGVYLKTDMLANKYYKKYKTCFAISKGFQVITLGGMIGVFAGVFTENDELMTGSLIAFIPSFAISWIVGSTGDKNFKTAVKTYNKNGGYGFINGLEKK